MIEVIPAILPKDWNDLKEKFSLVADYAPLVQVDIIDGKFTRSAPGWPYSKNGLDENFFKILREEEGMPEWQKTDFEVDLMVKNPEAVIKDWITAGAKRIVVHYESTDEETLRKIVSDMEKQFGGMNHSLLSPELGIAIEIDTPNNVLLPFIDSIGFVQCMGIVELGKQGEPFDERVIEKVDSLRREFPGVIISVDGGVNLDDAERLAHAGVNRLVIGSAIFEADSVKQAIEEFKKI